ncbi:MAG TPA: SusC/RagA family TonB-linked outer membrane protein [Bacteroidales bacterium]
MKLTTLLLFVNFIQISATVYSQNERFTFKVDKIQISELLNKIESESKYKFLYRSEYLNSTINVDAKNLSLDELLSSVFNKTDITYKVLEDNLVVITPKEFAAAFQQYKITGKITDAVTGEALVGASISVEGTKIGTISDVNGDFTIEVPNENSVLLISYVGYLSENIKVGGQSNFEIKLTSDIKKLEEIVVVGYGTMRKKDLTGSVIQIRPDRFENENPNTIQDVLRGTPGLAVGYDASAKGGGTMQIRGQRSVYTAGGHNDPLIILDGMIFYGELSEINPDDVGQIDVLKDASAAAVYGARAASGVIIITTKKGKQGKPVVTVTSNFGVTTKSAYREVYSPEGYMKFREDWYKRGTYGVNTATGNYEDYQSGSTKGKLGYYDNPANLGKYGVSLDTWRAYTTNSPGESDASIYARRLGLTDLVLKNYLAGRSFDWYNHTFRTGIDKDINASISGANEKMNYYMSLGYLHNEGAVVGNVYQSVRSNMKVEGKVNKWLEVGANVNFQNRSDGDIQPGLGTNYWDANQVKLSPYASHDTSGVLVLGPMGATQGYHYNYDFNRQYMDLEKGYTVLNSILNAKIKLPFNVTYSFNASPRYQFFYDRYFESAENPDWKSTNNGLVNREQTKRFDWSLNNTINWDYTFKEKHHINLTLVQEAEERQYWRDRIEARNILPSDALGFHNTANGDKTKSSYMSSDSTQTADALLARLFYSYNDRYMVTLSVRRDGYSAFGTNNPYATFPSAGFAWAFTNEKFFNFKTMSTGKLRFSYGKNGNRSLGDPYLSLANLGTGSNKYQGYLDASGNLTIYKYLSIDRLANPNLQWEKTEAYNVGLDYGFFNDRITGNIEYYIMNTKDMIMSKTLPGFSGFTSIATNLGEVSNSGIEFSINSENIKNSMLEWRTTFNFSYNKNEIKHLDNEVSDLASKWYMNQPISAIWDYKVTGIWQINEVTEAARYGQSPGDPKVANNYTADDKVNADGSITPVYNDKDKEFQGQTAPPISWSLRNEFTFLKNLTFSFSMYSFMGHKSLSTDYLNRDNDGSLITNGMNTFTKEYWTLENPTNKYARLDAQGPAGVSTPSKVYDRSFIRLDNISVSYSLPKLLIKKLNIEKVKVYGSIRNVAVWQKEWVYGDPETGGLATRIFTLGLNLTF